MERPSLSNVPLFSGFNPGDRAFLEDRLEEVRLDPGATLVQSGSKADRVFILARGWVRLLSSGGHELARLGPGSVVGEADALSGQTYSVQAEAVTQVRAWTLSVSNIQEMVRQFPASLIALDSALGFRSEVAAEGFADWLAGMAEFEGVSRADLRRLAGHLEPAWLEPGEDISLRSESGFAIIEQGSIELRDELDRPAIREGCFLYVDRSLLSGGMPSQGAKAVAPTMAWYLPAGTCARLQAEGLSVLRELVEATEPVEESVGLGGACVDEPVLEAAVPERAARARGRSGAASTGPRLSVGGRVRLALAALLVLWVLLSGVVGLLRSVGVMASVGGGWAGYVELQATARALTPMVLAQDVTSTPTFAPSPTPAATSTPVPTDTPVPPTATPVPTETAVPTDTPVPPTSTPAPPAAPAASQDAAAPAPTDTPVPARAGVDYRLVSWRQLTPCENHGMHNIFINVLDPAGNGIPGVPLHVHWGGPDGAVITTGGKPELGPGWAVFDMYRGTYWVRVNEGTSDTTPPLTVDIGEDQKCEETGNPVANSLYHYSYEVIFQRTW
ncbi:MAG: cyclic nucleotide-binding domain-containing protein [Anaerolineae bacterium]|nr:cyclic nucleotide-binding domain-containing protein [Anaerolineae bacterium]